MSYAATYHVVIPNPAVVLADVGEGSAVDVCLLNVLKSRFLGPV